MPRTVKAHFSLLITTLIFGFHYGIAKGIMPVPLLPMQLLFIRLFAGVIIFWIFSQFFVKEKVERKDLLIFALAGLVGFSLNQSFFYEGLNLTTPVDASIIHILNPVFVLVFAGIFIHEKITWMKVTGIVLGAFGALILILYGKSFNTGTDTFTGNILVFLNMLFYALYLILIKPVVAKYHTATIMKWVSLFGLIFIIPFSIRGITTFPIQEISLNAWLAVAYITVLNTFVAYLLINYSLKELSTSMVSFYSYLQPVIASLMAVSVGDERITFPKIIAAGFIFGGVFLVNRKVRANA
jgi:drug/metabolite transporter (DMT)-like permease